MERTVVFAASAPVPKGNRVEITQLRADGAVIAVHDLERGIRYSLGERPRDEVAVWRATVRDCAVAETSRGARTTLAVFTVSAAEAAAEALLDADAAAAAARAESDRWGGADRPPATSPDRFW